MNFSILKFSVLTFIALSFAIQTPLARAEMISTEQVAAEQNAQTDRAKVKEFLDRASVQARLQALGVHATLAKDRVDALTNQEVAMLAQKIDSLPAGGELSKTDLIIILLIAILVALVI